MMWCAVSFWSANTPRQSRAMATNRGVGARVRELRKSLELSQERLAEAASISRDGLARIERGNRTPGLATVTALADALGVKVEDLWQPNAKAPVPSKAAFRLKRIERALSKVTPGFADTVADAVEALCASAVRIR